MAWHNPASVECQVQETTTTNSSFNQSPVNNYSIKPSYLGGKHCQIFGDLSNPGRRSLRSHRSELMPVTLQHCSVINFVGDTRGTNGTGIREFGTVSGRSGGRESCGFCGFWTDSSTSLPKSPGKMILFDIEYGTHVFFWKARMFPLFFGFGSVFRSEKKTTHTYLNNPQHQV